MPELSGKAKELYLEAYSQDTYDQYTDSNDTWHGVPRTLQQEVKNTQYRHQPRHDVESWFWSLVSILLLALPKKSTQKDQREGRPNERAQFTWGRQRGQRMGPADKDEIPLDSRDVLLAYTEDDWAQALHPVLAPTLAPLLTQLAQQIRPEYALLTNAPHQEHLHEAVRRILLRHLAIMEDPLPLTPRQCRDLNCDVKTIHVCSEDTTSWPEHLRPDAPPPLPKVMLRLPKRPRADDDSGSNKSMTTTTAMTTPGPQTPQEHELSMSSDHFGSSAGARIAARARARTGQ